MSSSASGSDHEAEQGVLPVHTDHQTWSDKGKEDEEEVQVGEEESPPAEASKDVVLVVEAGTSELYQRHGTAVSSDEKPAELPEPKAKVQKKKRKRARGIFQRLRDCNASFEHDVLRLEDCVEAIAHRFLCILQWFLLWFKPREHTQADRTFGYIFNPVSLEESPSLDDPSRQYIWILYELRRKFILTRARRMYIYKIILLCLLITLCVCIGAFYAATVADYNAHVRYVYIDPYGRGEIYNMLHVPPLPPRYNEDIDWLLYSPLGQRSDPSDETESSAKQKPLLTLAPKLTLEALNYGYIEIPTRKFGRVNVSIGEITDRMESDSAEKGEDLHQPCLCAAHYGIPLNIILVRYSMEEPSEVGAERKPDKLYFEPRETTFVQDSVRGGMSKDPLVVPTGVRSASQDISPLDWEFQEKLKHGIDTTLSRKRFIVDLTNRIEKEVTKSMHGQIMEKSTCMYALTREKVSDKKIEKVKHLAWKDSVPVEITIGYSQFAMRGLNARGEKLPASWIRTPYAFCVSRCISALDPYV